MTLFSSHLVGSFHLKEHDAFFVCLDIIFLMMEIVHTGSPLSTIAEVLMQNICLRNERLDALPASRKDWLCRLLYTGKFEINIF